MKKTNNTSKIHYTGMGLIFGTGIGVIISILTTGNVIWGGFGTMIGLLVGAIIEHSKNK